MSIDAKIVSVKECDTPEIKLEHRQSPGRFFTMEIVNNPCPPLSGLIGCHVWGCSSSLMLGTTKIAKRIGCCRLKLLEKQEQKS